MFPKKHVQILLKYSPTDPTSHLQFISGCAITHSNQTTPDMEEHMLTHACTATPHPQPHRLQQGALMLEQ